MNRQQPARAACVVVGIPTFRRPRELSRLLEALPPHLNELEELLVEPADVHVVVVDNDAARTASAAVAAVAEPRVRYVVEDTPGVAAARNRVLDECYGLGADLVLFIDDDETPEPGWAAALVNAWSTWDVVGVSGRVVSRTPNPLDPWIDAGGFYARTHRQRLRAGDLVRRAATNNLLLELNAVRAVGLRFDDRFGLSGGEDSVFTGALVDRGYRIAWCPAATVVDHLTDDRATRAFVLRRSFVLANGTVRAEAQLAASSSHRRKIWIRALVAGTFRVLAGALERSWGHAGRSMRHDALGARMMARGLGELAAVLGLTPQPYSYGRAPIL